MRVAIYVRVSTDEQARHGYSLDHQEAECRRVAAVQGWEVAVVLRDEGYSGGSLERPGIRALLRETAARRVDVVLVWKTDRLSRWLPHIVDLVLQRLPAHGVAFYSATEPYETATPAGRMFFSQLASFADFERSMILERTASGRRAAALAGRWATGTAPYGYVLAGEKGRRHLLLAEPEAGVVGRIFAERLAGASVRGIATGLNRAGIAAPRGGLWSPQTVGRILSNPVYTGQAVWGRYRGAGRSRQALPPTEWLVVPQARHPALVDEATWEAVRRVGRRDTPASHRGRDGCRGGEANSVTPVSAGGTGGYSASRAGFLLTGILRCGLCGSRLLTQKTRKWQGYRCRRRVEVGAHSCPLPYINRARIEAAAMQAVSRQLDLLYRPAELRAGVAEATGHAVAALEGEISAIGRRIWERRQAEERWLRLFERGGVTGEWPEVQERVTRLRLELAVLEEERAAKQAELPALRDRLGASHRTDIHLPDAHGWTWAASEAFARMAPQEKAAVMRLLVRDALVFPARRLELVFWHSSDAGDAGDGL